MIEFKAFHFKYLGMCGGSASGKTTVAKRIISELGVPWVVIISLDSFYKVSYNAFRTLTCRHFFAVVSHKNCHAENLRIKSPKMNDMNLAGSL